MADEPDLRPGEGDPQWVTYLQGVLRSLGFEPGDEDGVFGDGTESAVRSLQEANNCTTDGWVGQETWQAIQRLLGGGSESTGSEADQGSDGGSGDVPSELVAMGLPASSEQFTDEQRQAVFVGRDASDEEEAGSPEGVELLAINEQGDDGSALA